MSTGGSLKDLGGNFAVAATDFWEINGVFVNPAPLRIGGRGGRSPEELIDLPVLRDPWNRLFIPGSSLKGVLRMLAESYLASVIAARMEASACSEVFSGIEPHVFLRECSPVPMKSEAGEEGHGRGGKRSVPRYCVNYLLFGCQELASHIHVYDSYALSASTFMRPRVAIDRFTGASRPGALFNVEYVAPGARWKIRIRIYGAPLSDEPEWRCAYETLAFLLRRIREDGIVVGGHASIGAGVLELARDEEIKVLHYTLSGPGRMKREKHSLNEYIELLLEKAGVRK